MRGRPDALSAISWLPLRILSAAAGSSPIGMSAAIQKPCALGYSERYNLSVEWIRQASDHSRRHDEMSAADIQSAVRAWTQYFGRPRWAGSPDEASGYLDASRDLEQLDGGPSSADV